MGAEVVPMPKKKIGSQTPTKSVILPYDAKKSLGREAIEIYEKSGRTAYDWQRFLVDAIMARNNDDLWTHMMFGFSVPRQNGKNEVIAIRELWGLINGECILHTAHRTTTRSEERRVGKECRSRWSQ